MKFPKYSSSKMTGDVGVNIVNKTVTELGWLFSRNHEENDFGIDGHVERVLNDGSVPGQRMAVQIKCGSSFFKNKNKRGYEFRLEERHLHYFSNYPIPVLIVLCDPEAEECFWELFSPEDSIPKGNSWVVTVPFGKILSESKTQLEQIFGPLLDAKNALEDFWSENEFFDSFDLTTLVIDRQMIEKMDTSDIVDTIQRLKASKDLAFSKQGKIELMFHGFDDDPRELYQVEEVRRYCKKLDLDFPEKFFFLRTEMPCWSLRVLMLCTSDIFEVSVRPEGDNKKYVEFDPKGAAEFLYRNWPGLNEMTDWLGMTVQENKKISFSVMRAMGFPIDE